MWLTGIVAPQHVGSSQTRARTRVPCISRQILNHCATREAPIISLSKFSTPFSLSSLSGTPVIHISVLLMVSHNSPRLSSLFFILSSLFSSHWVISKFLSNSQILSSVWSVLLLVLSVPVFISFFEFFSSRISLWFFFKFFFLFIHLFIHSFMAVLGLHFCARAFSSCGKWGPLFITVRRPLTVAASLVAEHRLQTRRLSNCGSRA